jgi:hypothetical protein
MVLAKRSNRVEKAVCSTPAERISKYVDLIVVVGCILLLLYLEWIRSDLCYRLSLIITQNTFSLETEQQDRPLLKNKAK